MPAVRRKSSYYRSSHGRSRRGRTSFTCFTTLGGSNRSRCHGSDRTFTFNYLTLGGSNRSRCHGSNWFLCFELLGACLSCRGNRTFTLLNHWTRSNRTFTLLNHWTRSNGGNRTFNLLNLHNTVLTWGNIVSRGESLGGKCQKSNESKAENIHGLGWWMLAVADVKGNSPEYVRCINNRRRDEECVRQSHSRQCHRIEKSFIWTEQQDTSQRIKRTILLLSLHLLLLSLSYKCTRRNFCLRCSQLRNSKNYVECS